MKHWQIFRDQLDEHVALGTLILAAFALRVYRLDAQALWWDESLSVYRATRDLGAVWSNVILIQNIVTIDTLPQLYFVLLNLLVRAFGISEFALRFFSVGANVATIPLLYVLARRWLGKAAGLIAALLGALSPFYVWYAQEARPYALLLFWSTLAIYALTRAFDRAEHRIPQTTADGVSQGLSVSFSWLAVYVLSAVASLYTHYYSIFLFPFHVILIAVSIWQTTNRRARAWIFLPAVPFAAVIFLIPQARASAAGNIDSGPVFVPLWIILRDLLNSFSVGTTVDLADAGWIDAVLAILFLLGILLPVAKLRFASSEFRSALLIFAFVFIPIAGVQVLSFLRPFYQNSRYLIAVSPAFYLAVAAGIVALMRFWKWLALPALTVFLIGAAISLNNLYFNPRFGKDDHRAWAEALRERVRPGDFLILDSPHTEELYRYYADDIVPMTTLPILRADGKPSPDADLVAVREAYRNHSRIWFLAMHVPFDDPSGRIEKLLNQTGVLIDQSKFAGTSTEIALSLFLPAMPVAQPNDIAHPLDVAFAGNLRLRGYDAPTSIEAGKHGNIKLFWQIDEPVGEDYAVSLRLIDNAGNIVGQWDTVPLGNRAGTSTWEPKKVIIDARDIAVVQSMPAGKYRWQVVPYHAMTGNPLGDVTTLGNIEVK